MKKTKKLFALLLALAMIMGISTTAFAQEVNSNKGGNATITIENASKGETYNVVKLFDASVTGKEGGSIVYTGTIPDSLEDYFEEVNGYIVAKGAAKDNNGDLSTDAVTAMAAWAKTAEAVATAKSDGSELRFTNLPYGYYVVTTTQGAAITVNSTNPNAVIYDKNSKTPGIVKSVNDADVHIGQTVTYTATSDTSNYLGAGKDAKKVVQYEISDTLPEFLKNVSVTSITIGATPYLEEGEVPQFGDDKKITIPWVNEYGNSIYENGVKIVITYTAVVTESAKIDGTTGNINKVTLLPYVGDKDNPVPWNEKWEDEEVIYTYATALQKVDENKKPLAGAKFSAKGLTVTGTNGVYTVVNYNSSETAYGTVMACDSEGQLVILGLPSDVTLILKEEEAPAGYNKLVNTINLPAQKTGEEIKATEKTVYYDENGKVTDTETSTYYSKTTYNVNLLKKAIVVVNQKGTELPTTGGMGTTMFYVFGSILVLAAVVLLVTKKRMRDAE